MKSTCGEHAAFERTRAGAQRVLRALRKALVMLQELVRATRTPGTRVAPSTTAIVVGARAASERVEAGQRDCPKVVSASWR